MGEPAELAWLVAYLASPAGDFTTGAVLTLDGARDNWMGAWPPRRSPQTPAPWWRRSASRSDGGPRQPADYATILDEHEQFWGERDLRPAHHPVLVHEFAGTSVALHEGDVLVGYLFGFVEGAVGYVHLVGVRDGAPPRGPGHTALGGVREDRACPWGADAQGHHHARQRDVDRLPPLAGHGGGAGGRLRRARPRPDGVHACARGTVAGLDHVLVAVPEGATEMVRGFYGGALGLPELEMPRSLRRPGAWFASATASFTCSSTRTSPPRRAHPALRLGGPSWTGGRAAGRRGPSALGRPAGGPPALLHPRPWGTGSRCWPTDDRQRPWLFRPVGAVLPVRHRVRVRARYRARAVRGVHAGRGADALA